MEPRYPGMNQQGSPNFRPPSNFSYFAEQSRRASYMGPEVRHLQHKHFRDPHNHHQYHFHPHPHPHPHPHHVHILPFPHPRPHTRPQSAPPIPLNAHAAIQREIEKQIIREEIIRSELARRHELEAEVRRELMVERELARQRNPLGSIIPLMGTRAVEGIIRPSVERESEENGALPFQRGTAEPKISEVKPVIEEGIEKGEIILLAKSDANTLGSKRKVDEPTPDPISHKKAREEWSCALCKVSANSEPGLNAHLNGKKHKHKESVLRAEWASKSGTIGFGISSKKATKKVEADDGMKVVTEGITHEKIISENNQSEDCKEKKLKYWCEMCKIGSNSKKVMKAHEDGRKHVRHVQENRLKNVIIVNHAEGTENGTKIVAECFTLENISSDNSKVAEPQNDVLRKKKFQFWCEVCHVGARNKTGLEYHEKGKRHLRRIEGNIAAINVVLENAKASSKGQIVVEGTSDMMEVNENIVVEIDETKAKFDKDMETQNNDVVET